jgi:hypothetical protein
VIRFIFRLLLQSPINIEILISNQPPNWLCCSCCSAPIATRCELHEQPQETLTQAVYTYLLDILGAEVPVYSATNTHDHRFDVVRVSLNETISPPNTSSPVELGTSAIQIIFRRLQEVPREPNGQSVDPDTAQHLLDDLDQLAREAQDTTDEEEGDGAFHVFAGRLVSVGQPSGEFSWFPGYTWTIASCRICNEHLGWIFHSPDSDINFQTLIVTRLREKYLEIEKS